MGEDDFVEIAAFEFGGEGLEDVGAGFEAGDPVGERSATAGRGDGRGDFERLPGAVDDGFDGEAAVGIGLERRTGRGEGAIDFLDAGVFGEDEVFQVLGNRPFTGVPFPGGLGMGLPTDGGEHPKARRFHFRD